VLCASLNGGGEEAQPVVANGLDVSAAASPVYGVTAAAVCTTAQSSGLASGRQRAALQLQPEVFKRDLRAVGDHGGHPAGLLVGTELSFKAHSHAELGRFGHEEGTELPARFRILAFLLGEVDAARQRPRGNARGFDHHRPDL